MMKTLYILLISIYFVTPTYAVEISKCEQSVIRAKADLKKGKICLMIQGGIVPIYKKGQKEFEQKYKVKYFDLGCMVPMNLCIEHYNTEVGKYLDKTHGKAWRKEAAKGLGN